MRPWLTLELLVSSLLCGSGAGFHLSNPRSSTLTEQASSMAFGRAMASKKKSSTALGAGFGRAVASKKKSSNKKTKKVLSTTPFDVSASLLRMEKVYDELSHTETKRIRREDDIDDPNEIVTAEYMIATRCSPVIADWVPVAQIILARPLLYAEASEGSADPLVRAAISQYCREISHVAGMGSKVFQSLPRNSMQYAVESVESFHKHVYEVAIEGKNENANNEQVMTKAEARRLLQIDDRVELADIKRTYRKMSMALHPDRFVGQSDDAKETGAAQYAKIKLAYETLQSGIRNGKQSWYESLGGRARTDFSVVSNLFSFKEAEELMTKQRAKAAVCGLDPELVQTFVARSQSATAK
eukprot:scaffold2829_cov147-Amphora_coffeaeformis.AAC.6